MVCFKSGENGGKAFCGTVCLLVLENAQEYEIAEKLPLQEEILLAAG